MLRIRLGGRLVLFKALGRHSGIQNNGVYKCLLKWIPDYYLWDDDTKRPLAVIPELFSRESNKRRRCEECNDEAIL